MTISGHMLRMAAAASRGGSAIGQPLGGGFYAGDMAYPNGDVYMIVVAPKAAEAQRAWKTANTDTPGTASLYDDRANTLAMNDSLHPAARFCLDCREGGFSDWSLPAKDTLGLIYTNRSALAAGAAAFQPDFYWTSTQEVASTAWARNFSDGSQLAAGKLFVGGWVRPVRRIKRN